MATEEKQASLSNAAASKGAGLDVAVESKQAVLERVAPVPSDISSYNTIQEYRDNVGVPSIGVSEYFLRKEMTDSRANYEGYRDQKDERQSKALAQDEELGSISGVFKQNIASAASGISRLEGHVLSAPSNIRAANLRGILDDETVSLFEREEADRILQQDLTALTDQLKIDLAEGKVTEEEANTQFTAITERRNSSGLTAEESAFLDAPNKRDAAAGGEGYDIGAPQTSRRELAQQMTEAYNNAESIRSAFENSGVSDLVNPINRDLLHADLSASYEQNAHYFEEAAAHRDAGGAVNMGKAVFSAMTGVGALVAAGTSDSLTNPSATFEYISENLPQLAVGAVSKTALAATNLGYGLDIYSQAIEDFKEHNNGELPSQKEATEMLGWSLGASALENVADLSLIRGLSKLPGAGGMVNATVERLAAKIGGSVANNAITRVGGAGVKGAITESLTEIGQTGIEENLSKLNTDFDGDSLFQAGVLGAATGGPLSGVGATRREIGKAALRQVESRTLKPAEREAYFKAIDTGDVTSYTDPESETYNPAVGAAALVAIIASEETTDEQKTSSRAQFEELLSIETEKAEVGRQAMREALEKHEADSEFDIGEAVDLYEESQKVINSLNVQRDNLAVADGPTIAEIEEIIEVAQTESSPEQAEAADRIVTLLMETPPDTLDLDDVKKLIEASGFNEDQQKIITNFTEAHNARNALNDIAGTKNDILRGRDGFKGIAQYENDVAAAVRDQNKEAAVRDVGQIALFAEEHQHKADAFQEAQKRVASTGENVYVVKDSSPTGWTLTNERPKGWVPFVTKTQDGGFTFGPSRGQRKKAGELTNEIVLEAEALNATSKQLAEVVNQAFDGATQAEPEVAVEEAVPVSKQETVEPQKEESVNEEVAPAPPVDDAADQALADATPDGETVQDIDTSINNEQEQKVDSPTLSAEEVEESVAEPEAESTLADDAEVTVYDGLLEGMNTAEPEVTGHADEIQLKEANLLTSYFVQSSGTEESASRNPLVEIKDFFSHLFEGGVVRSELAEMFLKRTEDLTEAQVAFLDTFKEYWNDSKESIANRIINSPVVSGFEHRDFSQYFVKDGALPENVTAAIALAGFSWLSENGNKLYNSEEEIRSMLGLDKNDNLDYTVIGGLRTVGTREQLLILELGNRAVKALGLRAKRDAPVDSQEKLQMALGVQVLASLIESGAVRRNLVSNDYFEGNPLLELEDKFEQSTLDDFGFPTSPVNEGQQGHPFIRIDSVQVGRLLEPDEDVKKIADQAKESEGLLNKLFGVESQQKNPTTESGTFLQKFTKGTKQLVPTAIAKISKAISKRPYFVRSEMKQIRAVFSRDTILSMAGYVDLSKGHHHKATMEGDLVRNTDLERSLDNLQDFESQNENVPFYMVPKIWVIQRAGFVANLVNPQTDKFQRHNISMDAWKTTIDLADTELLNRFKLAVAQGLGLDIEGQMDVDALAELETLMATDEMTRVISILQNAQSTTEQLSAEDQAAVAAVVAERGENFHSLDALVNWAKFQATPVDGSFETEMMFEVDGKTNGPALAHILTGHGDNFANKFGFYSDAQNIDGFSQWKSRGNLDIYETVAGLVVQKLQRLVSPQEMAVLEVFTGKLTDGGKVTGKGRNLVKTPLTSMVFGAGVDGAVLNMAGAFMDSFYDKLESSANESGLAGVQDAVKQMNFILGKDALVIPESIEQAMDIELSYDQQRVVIDAYVTTIGAAVSEVLGTEFEGFLESRGKLNSAAQIMWVKYHALFDLRYRQKIDAKIKAGEIQTTNGANKQPYQDLTEAEIDEIRQELKPFQPLIHTASSKMSGNLEEGIDVAKSQDEFVQKDDSDFGKSYSQEVKFDKPITSPDSEGSGKVPSGKVGSIIARGLLKRSSNPGVRAVIMLVHAMDAAISSQTLKTVMGLNIHDAIGTGVGNSIESAIELNRQTFQNLLDYSMSMEVMDALDRSLDAQQELLAREPDLEFMFDQLNLGFKQDGQPRKITPQLIEQIRKSAYDAEAKKLAFLLKVGVVDQYVLEGGAYVLTEADRKAVNKAIVALRAKIGEHQLSEYAPPAKLATPETTEFGLVNKAPDKKPNSTPSLVAALVKRPRQRVAQLRKAIQVAISEETTSPEISAFRQELLTQIMKVINTDTKIRYVTPTTKPTANDKAKKLDNARGWYSIEGGGRLVSIKSPDFEVSGVTSELLLHELTHATLEQLVSSFNGLTRDQVEPDQLIAFDSVKELETLLELAKTHIEANGLTKYAPAVKNIHELIAYGMTSPGFQTEVLANITMENTAATRTKESGLRAFIRNLAAIFFKKRNDVIKTNGMGVMIANTGLLFEAAADPREATQTETLTSVDPDPDTFTSQQVFEALDGNSDKAHSDHLKQVLRFVVDAVYGPGELLAPAAERNAPVMAEDVYLDALANKETPFASKIAFFLRMTEQEAFVAESTEVTVRETIAASATARLELEKLFNQAKAEVKPEDFYPAGANQTEKDYAHEVYNLLFTVESNNTIGSDFLSQFAAAALTYKPLFDKLNDVKVAEPTDSYSGKTLAERFKLFLKRLMNIYTKKSTGVHAGQSVSDATATIAVKLAKVHVKRKAYLKSKQERPDIWLEKKVSQIGDGVAQAVQDIADSPTFNKSGSVAVRALSGVISTIAGERVELVLGAVKKSLGDHSQTRLGILGEMYNEMRNGRDEITWANNLLDLANQHDQRRKAVKLAVTTVFNESFDKSLLNKKGLLSDDHTRALHKVLRTDPASLLKDFTEDEIFNMMSDTNALDAAIKVLESKLQTQDRKYFLVQAKALGHWLNTGEANIKNMMLNAHNIAFMAGVKGRFKHPDVNRDGQVAMDVINPLVTLYALKGTNTAALATVSQMHSVERARTDGGNGFMVALELHKGLQEEARGALFDNSDAMMIKGYMKETFNPHISIKSATASEGAELVKAGYVEYKKDLPRDDSDPSAEPRRLYVIRDKGLSPTITGFMGNTGKRAKGTQIEDVVPNVFDEKWAVHSARVIHDIQVANQEAVSALQNMDENFDPATNKNPNLVPIVSPNGDITGYRYLMTENAKEVLLDKETRVDHNIGATASSMMDKQGAPEINEQGIDALKAHYDMDYATNQGAFVEFSPNSKDPEVRERYATLSDDTKRHIRKTWGRNGMWIRNDMYNISMGYRKSSIGNAFDKVNHQRNLMEKLIVGFLESIVGKKAALRAMQVESVWQEVVTMVKDIFVIKNLFTFLGNEASNSTLLFLAGVPMVDIVKDKVIAFNATIKFQQDRRRRDHLLIQIDTGYVEGNDVNAARQEVLQLEEAMSQSPVKELIDAGMFQTLVEDISVEIDPYSYKTRLNRWADGKTSWIPQPVKTVGKTLLMTHDTTLYKIMNQATVLSDFTSRYVMYNHLINRRKDPMTKADALHRARQSFVNYDVPTHKSLQYLNDMGILWFTKYYLRIQAVIAQLVRENPARALMLIGANNLWGEFADILDSNMLGKSPVNLGMGMFELPGAVDEIITLKAFGADF